MINSSYMHCHRSPVSPLVNIYSPLFEATTVFYLWILFQ